MRIKKKTTKSSARRVATRGKCRPKKKKKLKKSVKTIAFARFEENPIILPKAENGWEAWQTFNPGVILLVNRVHFFYRAIGEGGISRFGYASSNDGFKLDDKDACIFPEKFKGKYLIIHRVGDDIDFAFSSTLDFTNNIWLEEYRWVTPRKGMWDSKKVGIAAPPIKTKDGWLLFYHGISEEDKFYRVGALLLDLKDPTKVIARTNEPLLEPETKYEKEGQVPNVVFPCGAVLN